MRIAKQSNLNRLLQTQDVLLAGLTFVGLLNFLWLANLRDLSSIVQQLPVTLFVVLFAVFGCNAVQSGLGATSQYSTFVYAFRMALISTLGPMLIEVLTSGTLADPSLYLLFAVVLFTVIILNRVILRWWYFSQRREAPHNFLKVLVIGSGNRAQALIQEYRDHSEWGIDIVGIVDPEQLSEHVIDLVPVLGTIADVPDILSTTVIDEVVVCLPRSMIGNIEGVIASCAEQAVCVKFLADLYDMPGVTISLDSIGDRPTLVYDPVHQDNGKLLAKRILDLFVAIPALAILAPIFVVVAIAIKFNSKGPVFFRQERVGLNKRHFRFLKFRSMYMDAEARLAEIEHLNQADGPIFKMDNDPRVTSVGEFIRRTSIDELPQLFNVLIGHMSLIGPRPMSLRDVGEFSLGIQRKRFSVKPGLACLREINGRSQLSFERWLELDLQYIEEWTIWLDIKILFKLIPVVLKGEGAV